VPGRSVASWITGETFGWLRERGLAFEALPLTPAALAELLEMLSAGEITPATARGVLADLLSGAPGRSPRSLVAVGGLQQVSDAGLIGEQVRAVLQEHPAELAAYLAGKSGLANWFFGQVMRRAGGLANPQVIRAELERQLGAQSSEDIPEK